MVRMVSSFFPIASFLFSFLIFYKKHGVNINFPSYLFAEQITSSFVITNTPGSFLQLPREYFMKYKFLSSPIHLSLSTATPILSSFLRESEKWIFRQKNQETGILEKSELVTCLFTICFDDI